MVATKLQFCLQTHAQVFGTSMPRAVEVAFFVPRSASASAFGSAPLPPSMSRSDALKVSPALHPTAWTKI